MRTMKQPVIKNSKGEVILLNKREQYHADQVQKELNLRHQNSLGFEINVTTLTTIVKEISGQKFYEIPFADYLPVRVGQGQWSDFLTTYRSFNIADDFETGIILNGGNNTRMATADAAVDALNIAVYPWAKETGWTIFQLEQASRSGNWDLVAAKEEARKTNWDLGLQRIAFLGAKGMNDVGGSCLGLLNQASVVANTSVITQPISQMGTSDLKQFCATVIEAYRSNCNRTAWPTHFIIPESDYNGLAAQASADFPIKSTLQLLEEMFMVITRNKNFKILPLAYGDVAYSGYSYQQYVLLNYDPKSIRMDIPLDYTNTLANSVNNFNFLNCAYGQFTGVLAYRPLEVLYFRFVP